MRKIVLIIATASIFALAIPAFATETENTDTAAAPTDAEPTTDELPALPDKVASTPITFGLDIKTDYILDDGIRSTDGLVFQPSLSATITEGLTANGWASVGMQPRKNREAGKPNGNELDVGFTDNLSLGHGINGRLTFNHYFLFDGVPDMQEVTVAVEKKGFELAASYFPWAGGMQDGFRVTGKYSFNLTKSLSGTVGGVYEKGFEAPRTFVALAGLSLDLGHGFSGKVNAYLPYREDGIHERRVVFGISFNY